ncbi:glutamate 5-kinase [Desulfohalobiaceae bacterium Ax17]|uniref:glutamate 5-kinase n=1 Tax=Desulfovulcanus ferrireducens TaxID=2831190 RepID=UPI00207BB040|nr:glutamate 5-kinase [Desulfovulcanus ferrireducens]MBT8764334.1 glutamate 5-kinase [Desulfovulcanus ferrireducens]
MLQEYKKYKEQILNRAKKIVIKVGSAVLTGANGLDPRVINRLADEISLLHDQGRDILLVSSGAVAAGCKVMTSCKVKECLAYKQAVSAIGQSRLMHAYDEAFARYNKITAQILLTKDDLKSRERFLNARNTLLNLLSWKVIPIINENDTVVVQELKFGDNDALAALVLNLVEADLFINLTSADGVYNSNPMKDKNAKLLPYIKDISKLDLEEICQGKTTQGTGGMYSKLLAARRAAQIGVPTLIVSGKVRFALERVFSGEELGTFIFPEEKSISRRKFWLAYNLDSRGEVLVDKGAVEAIVNQGKSLLPAGIVDVRGKFGKGALVKVIDAESGESLGVGLTNYKSSELKQIMGRKSSEIENILGQCAYSEAIHRDNFLLGAAL